MEVRIESAVLLCVCVCVWTCLHYVLEELLDVSSIWFAGFKSECLSRYVFLRTRVLAMADDSQAADHVQNQGPNSDSLQAGACVTPQPGLHVRSEPILFMSCLR